MTVLSSVEDLVSILQRCMKEGNVYPTWCLHGYMKKCGSIVHKLLGSYLIAVFLEDGRVDDAHEILNKLEHRYRYSWNALIICCIHRRNFQLAFTLYEKLQRVDSLHLNGHDFVAVIKACTDLKDPEIALQLHAEVARIVCLEQNIFVGTALVTMYAKCGSLVNAQEVFNMHQNQDISSWNALISGYVAFGDGKQVLNCFENMQMRGVLPNSITFVCMLKVCGIVQAIGKGHEIHTRIGHAYLDENPFLGNALVDMYAKCGFLTKAQQVFDILPVHDTISWNVLITAYARHGLLVKAQELFDKLLARDIVSWNALIAGYAENGNAREALKCYNLMLKDGISPNSSTFVSTLKACGSIGAEDNGRKIHDEIIKRKLVGKDLMVGRSLIDMYAKCGAFAKAYEVYRKLPSRDTVSLTALVAGYAKHGLFAEAHKIFNELQVQGVISWNALIAGYVEYGYNKEAIECFDKMQQENVPPNNVTFVCALKACSSRGAIDRGQAIYAEISRKGWLEKDISIGNILIDMYAKGNFIAKAREVLEELPHPDLVSWNALMAGYAAHGYVAKAKEVFDMLKVRDVITWNTLIVSYAEYGQAENALHYFDKMHLEGVLPDVVTFATSLKACSFIGDLNKGYEIHNQLIKTALLNDLSVCNALIDMYAKCDSLMKAQEVFNNLPSRNVVSWNTIIGGYAEHEYNEEALEYFEKMQSEGVSGDAVTFIYCLKACSNMGALDRALKFHVEIVRKGFLEKDVGNTLIDFYAKHGMFAEAQSVFEQLSTPDVVSWNALISGYAQQGEIMNVGNIFDKMVGHGIKPTLVTFVNILKACSQKGLFDEAQIYYEAMNKVYGVLPTAEHHNCMIDLLGRVGHLDKVVTMINKIQGYGNLVIWHGVLDACRQWGNLEFAKQAFQHALQLDKKDAAAYILMSYIYASTTAIPDEEKKD